jgi:hypothetical protein
MEGQHLQNQQLSISHINQKTNKMICNASSPICPNPFSARLQFSCVAMTHVSDLMQPNGQQRFISLSLAELVSTIPAAVTG